MCPIDLRSCQAFKKVRGPFRVKVLQVSIRAQMPADGAVHRHALGTTEIFAMLTPIRAAVQEATHDTPTCLHLGGLSRSHAATQLYRVKKNHAGARNLRLKSQNAAEHRNAREVKSQRHAPKPADKVPIHAISKKVRSRTSADKGTYYPITFYRHCGQPETNSASPVLLFPSAVSITRTSRPGCLRPRSLALIRGQSADKCGTCFRRFEAQPSFALVAPLQQHLLHQF